VEDRENRADDASRERLAASTLYLVTSAHPGRWDLGEFLGRVLGAGVDVVQLREKDMEAGPLLAYCETARRRTEEFGALFIVNDRLDVAVAAGAEGVHLGQDDLPAQAARAQIGAEMLVGLSTHSEDQIEAANRLPVDYIGVGPVLATPTKPGRPAVGVGLVRSAVAKSKRPFYAIGGVDLHTLPAIIEAGATRVSVMRALTAAEDPAKAASAIRAALDSNRQV